MPFPPVFSNLLLADPTIDTALENAFNDTEAAFPGAEVLSRICISLVAIDDDPLGFRHAGRRETETHYSASLLKVAAMLGAFQLRQSANNLAADPIDASAADFFARLKATFDPPIEAAVPLISTNPQIAALPVSQRLPKYQSMFAAIPLIGGGHSVVFGAAFANNIRGMMIPGNNDDAAACVKAQGYQWIDGVLSAAGLFREADQQGIWLAGTFTGALPAVRIPSINDGPSAQAATCIDLANLFAHIIEANEIDSNGNTPIAADMLQILGEAAVGHEPSFMKPGARPNINGLTADFTTTHTKIGLGALKPENGGFEIVSEATVVQHNPTGRRFIVVWQNVRNTVAQHNVVGFLVERAMRHVLGVP